MSAANIPALTEIVTRAEERRARCEEQLRRAEAACCREKTPETRHALTRARAAWGNAVDELSDAEHALMAARIAEVA
jgi:hypothetical protein